MPRLKLSKTVVERLSPQLADILYWDTALVGFGIRVKPNGTKSYVVQYRNRNTGRSRRKTLGQAGPLMSYAQAKSIASGLLSDVVRGGDPVAEAKAMRDAPTMSDLVDQYLAAHARPKKRPKSVANDVSMINRHILPKLASRKVGEIGNRDVQGLHNSLSKTPYQANRVLSLLSKMFELSIRWGWRSDNPVRGVEKYHEEKRHRWLSETELSRLTMTLDAHPNQLAANAIRLQLLTGARIGEVLSAKWQDFDLNRGVWIKPSHHTKQKRTEHLPLSRVAQELVASIKSQSNRSTDYLFPSRVSDGHIVDLKKFWRSVVTTAELDDYRIHDNRHTHASHLVSSGLSLAIVGRLLGHTNPITTQRYAHLADDPLREAAELFGKKFKKSEN